MGLISDHKGKREGEEEDEEEEMAGKCSTGKLGAFVETEHLFKKAPVRGVECWVWVLATPRAANAKIDENGQ